MPEYDDRALYEKLILDGFQAGLSWITIMRKRENFRSAFAGFDPRLVSEFDEEDVARVLAGMLASFGFRCDVAATGREAQRLLRDRDYDAVLCDLRMPDTDGQPLYGWLEENRAHLCPRTAFVTGDTLSPTAAGFLARTGRPVLEQPFAPEEGRRLVAVLAAGGPSDR